MKFNNGEHLTNYILKIFKNKNVTLQNDVILDIKNLSNVYKFIEELPDEIKLELDNCDDYGAWISIAINEDYSSLREISINANKMITDFSNRINVSFLDVINSFKLGITYKLSYINNIKNTYSIYYPKMIPVLTEYVTKRKLKVFYYSKPDIKRDAFGCYMIYQNNEIVYIGKSNSSLIKRACESASERTDGNFDKIELYEFSNHADANIYEIYLISVYHPKYNIESCSNDKPTFCLKLPENPYVVNKVDSEEIDADTCSTILEYIDVEEYFKNKEKYFLCLDPKNYNYHDEHCCSCNNFINNNVERIYELQENYITYVQNVNNKRSYTLSRFLNI